MRSRDLEFMTSRGLEFYRVQEIYRDLEFMRSRDLEFMRSRGQEIYTDTNSPFCDADIFAHIHVDYMVRGLTTLVASTHCLFDLKF